MHPFQWTHPSTWPWIVWVWLAFTAAAWSFNYLKEIWKRRTSRWPVTGGKIERTAVNPIQNSFLSSSPSWSNPGFTAEIEYSYSLLGGSFEGEYRRPFGIENDAREFIRDLEGRPVPVSYNPNKPSVSALLDASVDAVLQTRAPVPGGSSLVASQDPIPVVLRYLIRPFMYLAAFGLAVSGYVYIASVTGRYPGPDWLFYLLHVGIFAVFFPAVVITSRRVGNIPRKDYWRVALNGCPDWMRYALYVLFAYCFMNFFASFANFPSKETGGINSPAQWRTFSCMWMVFYYASPAILYSAERFSSNALRCPSGHILPPGANFCSICGQPVVRS